MLQLLQGGWSLASWKQAQHLAWFFLMVSGWGAQVCCEYACKDAFKVSIQARSLRSRELRVRSLMPFNICFVSFRHRHTAGGKVPLSAARKTSAIFMADAVRNVAFVFALLYLNACHAPALCYRKSQSMWMESMETRG